VHEVFPPTASQEGKDFIGLLPAQLVAGSQAAPLQHFFPARLVSDRYSSCTFPRMLRTTFLLLACSGCDVRGSHAAASETPPAGVTIPAASASVRASIAESGPIRIEVLRADERPPTFVMRGGPRGQGRLVFLHGMCGHGLGYAQSFQFSAAKLGTLIAPQADVSCGDVWSKWSTDVKQLDQRIVSTFRELGHPEPIDDVTVIGMSQGATRAVDLVRRFPARYTRLIAMAAPTAIQPGELKSLKSAVMMAGERDRQDLMRRSERALRQSGVPASFLLIPEATHGAMGPAPERTMGEAFQLLSAGSPQRETRSDPR
jgi:predicted esterase